MGEPCYGGLDLGQSDDVCAFVRIWDLADGRVAVRPRFWRPAAALVTYRTRPYDQWRRAGVLEVTEGDVTDLDVVEAAVLADCRASEVRELAYDKRFASQLAQHLQGQGIAVVGTPQGFRLNEAITKVLALIVEGQLCHGGHPILTWMASNVVVRHGRCGEVRLDKERAPEKIDGFAALVMAFDRVVRRPAPEPAWSGEVKSCGTTLMRKLGTWLVVALHCQLQPQLDNARPCLGFSVMGHYGPAPRSLRAVVGTCLCTSE